MVLLLSVRIFFMIVLLGLIVSFLHADLSSLPTVDAVLPEINGMLRRNDDCERCGEILRNIDKYQRAQSNPLLKAMHGQDKPQNAFIRACEENPNNIGCDTALDRYRVEKTKRAALIISQAENVASEINDGVMMNLVRRRRHDFTNYLLDEKEQEHCTTCVVEDGREPRMASNPLADSFLGYVWFLIVPVNERHQKFCWQHCEGQLSTADRMRLWFLRMYVLYGVRARLIAVQGERATMFFICIQLFLLANVLQRYVANPGTAASSAGVAPVGANGHFDGVKTSYAARRAFLGRGRGGRKD